MPFRRLFIFKIFRSEKKIRSTFWQMWLLLSPIEHRKERAIAFFLNRVDLDRKRSYVSENKCDISEAILFSPHLQGSSLNVVDYVGFISSPFFPLQL